jgi:PAS domain S-box-containing protein
MSTLNGLSTERETGFLIVDQSWQIVDLSTTVHRLADEPSVVSRGQDARLGFPELFGLEDCLDQLLQATQESFKLKGVDRSIDPLHPLYIDLCLFKNHEYDSTRSTFIILIEDATERMVLQQALVQSSNETSLLLKTLMASKEYVDQVVGSMVDALVVTTRSGQIKTANLAAQLLLEYSESELTQRSIATLFSESEIPTSETSIKSLKQCVEATCQTKSGRQIPVDCSISIVQTEVEDFQGFVYTLRDITERQQADQITQS